MSIKIDPSTPLLGRSSGLHFVSLQEHMSVCRYIPVGLLERLPQRINERPPPYFGRNDLETLLSSGNCADWVKIR